MYKETKPLKPKKMELTTQILKTNHRTINKAVKKQILDLLLPNQSIKTVVKKYVPACGHVFYFKNQFGITLITASKENTGITLRYKR